MANSKAQTIVTHSAWSGLLGICLLISAYGFSKDQPIVTWLLAYTFLVISLLALEKWLPFEKEWQKSDGQAWNDIGHTIVNKGFAQALAVFASVVGLKQLIHPIYFHEQALWPDRWPMFYQVILGLVSVEFILYWAHRLAHEWPLLWRFHALHHSVLKLWVVNTGRFHFIESGLKVVGLTLFMLLMGMPMIVIYWVSAVTAYIGVLTHCNVEMHTNFNSWLFNTPNLHRWHHSPRLEEGNKNYGENIMIWDHLFGSFFNPARRPATDIGLNEGHMPVGFWAQLVWPFKKIQKA